MIGPVLDLFLGGFLKERKKNTIRNERKEKMERNNINTEIITLTTCI